MTMRWSTFHHRASLTDHGPVSLREAAVEILEHYIQSADPYPQTLNLVKRKGNQLHVGRLVYKLDDWKHIYIVGAGKASQSVALGLEDALGDRITDGVVILKRGEPHYLRHIRILEAAHPVPDQASWDGAKEIVRIAELATEDDLVIAAFTGGSSSLMVWPWDGITLEDKQVLNTLLLGCGASIQEVNAVRKHVSFVKGGRLGLMIFPAELINLTVSDVIGDVLDCITDLTVPDSSTYKDAWNTLEKYSLWDLIPTSIRAHLLRGPDIETPKKYSGRYHSFICVTSKDACKATAAKCREMGFETYILTNSMEGESHIAAVDFINSAHNILRGASSGKRYAFLASGETTVTLNGVNGEGGRNQEFSLSAARHLAGKNGMVVASVATDGTDGPTDACGGLVDSCTVSRAINAGLDTNEALFLHTSKKILSATGDLLVSGPTGTNINDVALLLVDQ